MSMTMPAAKSALIDGDLRSGYACKPACCHFVTGRSLVLSSRLVDNIKWLVHDAQQMVQCNEGG